MQPYGGDLTGDGEGAPFVGSEGLSGKGRQEGRQQDGHAQSHGRVVGRRRRRDAPHRKTHNKKTACCLGACGRTKSTTAGTLTSAHERHVRSWQWEYQRLIRGPTAWCLSHFDTQPFLPDVCESRPAPISLV